MERTTDRHFLLSAIAGGDESALRELYDATSREVYRYLCRFTGDETLARELTVDTYTEVWRSAGGCRDGSRPLAWIIGIARVLALSRKRQEARHPADDDEDIEGVGVPPAQLALLEGCQTAGVVRHALGELDPRHGEILDLFFLHDMGYAEIASALKIPLNTVKTRLFNAKRKMAEALHRLGFHRDDLL